ncbi:MAG: hypothetical protein D6753_17205, partial [Planctomycetota bacterium]
MRHALRKRYWLSSIAGRSESEIAPTLAGRLLVLLVFLLPGCGGEAPGEASSDVVRSQNPAADSTTSAADTLRRCIDVYQKLNSYCDDGQVVLRYRLDGRPEEDIAPMRVAIDRTQRRLGLEVYSVQAGPAGGRWYLRCRDGDERIAGQILSRRFPRQLRASWLLEDAIVTEKLSAGLAGFPVQLNLLLDERPLDGLLDDATEVRFESPAQLRGRSCLRIAVHRHGDVYRLWIDQASRLLRRIEFPPAHLSPAMLDDRRVTDIELFVDLVGARANGPIDWSEFEVQPQDTEMRLVRFVPKPLSKPDPLLAETPPAFQLSGPNAEVVYRSDAQFGRRGTLLLWLADHPASRKAAGLLRDMAAALEDNNLQDRFLLVPVWAEPQPAEGTTFATLASAWDLPGRLAIDRQAVGRDLFGVMTAPTLVVLDDRGRVQLRMPQLAGMQPPGLMRLLSRLAAGENVGQVQHSAYRNALRRHAAELQIAASSDATPRYASLDDYDPITARLESAQLTTSPTRIVAATGDQTERWWCLAANGDLMHFSAQGDSPPEVITRTPWRPQSGGKLALDPAGRWVAWYDATERLLELLDLESNAVYQPHLPSETKLADLQWIPILSGAGSALAMLTSDRQVLLCEPAQRIQLQGRAAGEPIALVRHSAQAEETALLLMADGLLQPWRVDRALQTAFVEPGVESVRPADASPRARLTSNQT